LDSGAGRSIIGEPGGKPTEKPSFSPWTSLLPVTDYCGVSSDFDNWIWIRWGSFHLPGWLVKAHIKPWPLPA
jgi:hypothetical protein